MLSICIVSYNTAELTIDAVRSCLDDILSSKYVSSATEIIIIDNNSKDDSVTLLKKIKKETDIPIHIIESEKNLGFAGGNNLAIANAKGKYIFLLNSDTYVQSGCLDRLIETFEGIQDKSTASLSSYGDTLDRLGIAAATLLNPDGTYQPQGGSYPNLFSLFNHMLMLHLVPFLKWILPSTQKDLISSRYINNSNKKLIKKDWVAGTAMLIRADTLAEIGDLDEAIFMYAEDMELCIRAKDHHWDVVIVPSAFVTHLKSASSNSSKAILGEFKGYQYIWAKHKASWQLGFATLLMRIGASLRVLLFGTMKKQEKATTYKIVLQEL